MKTNKNILKKEKIEIKTVNQIILIEIRKDIIIPTIETEVNTIIVTIKEIKIIEVTIKIEDKEIIEEGAMTLEEEDLIEV